MCDVIRGLAHSGTHRILKVYFSCMQMSRFSCTLSLLAVAKGCTFYSSVTICRFSSWGLGVVRIEKCPFVATRARLGSSSFASHYPSRGRLYITWTGTSTHTQWVDLSHETKGARGELGSSQGVGISNPTLRKWTSNFGQLGVTLGISIGLCSYLEFIV